MAAYKIITVSQTGTIGYYQPPQTTPHKTIQTHAPDAISNTLPLLTHHKSAIHQPSAKSRISTTPITALTSLRPILATGNSEGFVTIYNLPTNNPTTVPLHVNAVTELRICDSAETLLSSGVDGFVHITRLAYPTKPFASLRHSLPVTAFVLGYASTTARVVTASTDRCTRVFHLSSTRLLTTVRHSERVASLAIGPGEDYWWGGCDGSVGHVAIAELPVGGIIHGKSFAKRDFGVGALVKAPDGLVVGFDDGVVQIFDCASNVLIRSFGGGPGIARVFVEYAGDDAGDMFEAEGIDGVIVGKRQGKQPWEVLRDVAEDVFRDDAPVAVDVAKEVRILSEEVERLRKRNRQLEDAGTRLIELVERDG